MLTIIVAASVVLGSHVRVTDPVVQAALTNGLQQSEVIRRLVALIDASDLIVYLSRGDCPGRAVACLRMGGAGANVRYVHINFRRSIGPGAATGWHKGDLSETIAHELQHAVEIASWPGVVDGETLRIAYIGHGDRELTHLDSDAALRAGIARRDELRRRRR